MIVGKCKRKIDTQITWQRNVQEDRGNKQQQIIIIRKLKENLLFFAMENI